MRLRPRALARSASRDGRVFPAPGQAANGVPTTNTLDLVATQLQGRY
jgi:hypothetical protein